MKSSTTTTSKVVKKEPIGNGGEAPAAAVVNGDHAHVNGDAGNKSVLSFISMIELAAN